MKIKVDAHALGILAKYSKAKTFEQQQELEVDFDMSMEDLAEGRRKGRPSKEYNIEIDMTGISPFYQAYPLYREAHTP